MADLEQVVNDLNLASQSLQELREKYDGALDLLDNKNTEITGALENAKSNALQEVQTANDIATSQISQLKDTSLNLVNEAKNTAIEEVNNVVYGIDASKEEALLEIEQAKAAQEEKIASLEQAKEDIITELSEKAKLLTQKLEWTVGSGGNFEDLQEALLEAAKYFSIGLKITITIKNGTVLQNNININTCNLGHTIIKSENNHEVQYNGDNIKFTNCIPPFIQCIFKSLKEDSYVAMDNCINLYIGDADTSKKSGFKNFSLVQVLECSGVYLNNFIFESSNSANAKYSSRLYLRNCSSIDANRVDLILKLNGSETDVNAVRILSCNFDTSLFNLEIVSTNTSKSNIMNILNSNLKFSNFTVNATGILGFLIENSNIDFYGSSSEITINGSNDSSLFNLGNGTRLTYSTKPTINYTGTKCNIPYGQLTVNGAFCQTLE